MKTRRAYHQNLDAAGFTLVRLEQIIARYLFPCRISKDNRRVTVASMVVLEEAEDGYRVELVQGIAERWPGLEAWNGVTIGDVEEAKALLKDLQRRAI